MPLNVTMRTVVRTAKCYQQNDLLSYASAIAFQALFALVPSVLAAVALLGFFDLEEVWQQDIAPELRQHTEPDAFSVIDRTVNEVLGERRGLWLTFGLAFMLWQVSGAVRATMGPVNRIYHDEEERSFVARFLLSLVLAPVIAASIGLALATIHLGDDVARWAFGDGLVRGILFPLRWALALVLLFAAIWLLLRYSPARRHELRWTSLGALFTVFAWVVTSLAFGWYATTIADYGSVFGNLAFLIILMTYLYLSAGAFLLGVQFDGCLRDEAQGDGEPAEDEEDGAEGRAPEAQRRSDGDRRPEGGRAEAEEREGEGSGERRGSG